MNEKMTFVTKEGGINKKEQVLPELSLPTLEELRDLPLSEIQKRWESNHDLLLDVIQKHRHQIPRLGIHGAAKDDLKNLLSSRSGSIRVATFDHPSSDESFLRVLYAMCEYVMTYAYHGNRARTQGIGGVVYLKAEKNANEKQITGITGKINTNVNFPEAFGDSARAQELSRFIRRQYDDTSVPMSESACDGMLDFSTNKDPHRIPVLFYDAEQIGARVGGMEGPSFSDENRLVWKYRFLDQDMIHALIEDLLLPQE